MPSAPLRHGFSQPDPAGLFELPVELRLQIYHYLLPAVERDWWVGCPLEMHTPDEDDHQYWSGDHYVEDHRDEDDYGWNTCYDTDEEAYKPEPIPKNTTAFMRTCHQIYHEACDYLYEFGRFGVDVFCHGSNSMHVLNKTIKLDEIRKDSHSHFAALQHIRRLDIMVTTDWHGRNVCEAQALLDAMSRWLQPFNRLQKIHVYLDVFMPCDGHQHVGMSYMKWQLRNHRATDVSRQHIASFFMDPIRNPSSASEDNAAPKISLHFKGYRLAAFKHLPKIFLTDIQDCDAQGYRSQLNAYTAAFEDTIMTLRPLFDTWFHTEWYKVGKQILDVRVRGNVKRLRTIHEKFIKDVLVLLMPGCPRSRRQIYDHVKRDVMNDEFVNIGRCLSRLSRALPSECNTSDFGVNHVDRAISTRRERRKTKSMEKKRRAREQRKADRKRLKAAGECVDDSSGQDEGDFYLDEYGYGGGSDGADDSESDAEGDGWNGLVWV